MQLTRKGAVMLFISSRQWPAIAAVIVVLAAFVAKALLSCLARRKGPVASGLLRPGRAKKKAPRRGLQPATTTSSNPAPPQSANASSLKSLLIDSGSRQQPKLKSSTKKGIDGRGAMCPAASEQAWVQLTSNSMPPAVLSSMAGYLGEHDDDDLSSQPPLQPKAGASEAGTHAQAPTSLPGPSAKPCGILGVALSSPSITQTASEVWCDAEDDDQPMVQLPTTIGAPPPPGNVAQSRSCSSSSAPAAITHSLAVRNSHEGASVYEDASSIVGHTSSSEAEHYFNRSSAQTPSVEGGHTTDGCSKAGSVDADAKPDKAARAPVTLRKRASSSFASLRTSLMASLREVGSHHSSKGDNRPPTAMFSGQHGEKRALFKGNKVLPTPTIYALVHPRPASSSSIPSSSHTPQTAAQCAVDALAARQQVPAAPRGAYTHSVPRPEPEHSGSGAHDSPRSSSASLAHTDHRCSGARSAHARVDTPIISPTRGGSSQGVVLSPAAPAAAEPIAGGDQAGKKSTPTGPEVRRLALAGLSPLAVAASDAGLGDVTPLGPVSATAPDWTPLPLQTLLRGDVSDASSFLTAASGTSPWLKGPQSALPNPNQHASSSMLGASSLQSSASESHAAVQGTWTSWAPGEQLLALGRIGATGALPSDHSLPSLAGVASGGAEQLAWEAPPHLAALGQHPLGSPFKTPWSPVAPATPRSTLQGSALPPVRLRELSGNHAAVPAHAPAHATRPENKHAPCNSASDLDLRLLPGMHDLGLMPGVDLEGTWQLGDMDSVGLLQAALDVSGRHGHSPEEALRAGLAAQQAMTAIAAAGAWADAGSCSPLALLRQGTHHDSGPALHSTAAATHLPSQASQQGHSTRHSAFAEAATVAAPFSSFSSTQPCLRFDSDVAARLPRSLEPDSGPGSQADCCAIHDRLPSTILGSVPSSSALDAWHSAASAIAPFGSQHSGLPHEQQATEQEHMQGTQQVWLAPGAGWGQYGQLLLYTPQGQALPASTDANTMRPPMIMQQGQVLMNGGIQPLNSPARTMPTDTTGATVPTVNQHAASTRASVCSVPQTMHLGPHTLPVQLQLPHTVAPTLHSPMPQYALHVISGGSAMLAAQAPAAAALDSGLTSPRGFPAGVQPATHGHAVSGRLPAIHTGGNMLTLVPGGYLQLVSTAAMPTVVTGQVVDVNGMQMYMLHPQPMQLVTVTSTEGGMMAQVHPQHHLMVAAPGTPSLRPPYKTSLTAAVMSVKHAGAPATPIAHAEGASPMGM